MGHITVKEKRAFRELLLVDVLRGKHSTGVATVSAHGDVEVFKKAVNAMDFLDFKGADVMLAQNSNCIIGHNRYATKGEINNVNAHPFEFSELVGAHNGTLTQLWKLDDYHEFDVDSENLYHHINKNGITDAFDKVCGALALTWYDKVNSVLCLLRNKERPLSYCYSEDKKTLFWASEAWMLRGVLARCGISITPIVFADEDMLYEFAVPRGFNTGAYPLAPPKTRLLEKTAPVKKSLSLVSGSSKNSDYVSIRNRMKGYIGESPEFFVERRANDKNGQPYILCTLEADADIALRVYLPKGSGLWDIMNNSVNSFTGKISHCKEYRGEMYLLVKVRTVQEVEYNLGNSDENLVDGYGSEKLNYENFRKATSEGCSWCTGNAEFGQDTLFLSHFDFVCHRCLALPEVQDYLNQIS